jgi:hypothetical protein
MRFKVNPTDQPISTGEPGSTASRHVTLLAGTPAGSYGQTRTFGLYLIQGGAPDRFGLGWGMSLTSAAPLMSADGELPRGQWHTLVLYHRADNRIDLYLNGKKLATRRALPGEAGMLFCGDSSGATGLDLEIDQLRIGAPKPDVVPK